MYTDPESEIFVLEADTAENRFVSSAVRFDLGQSSIERWLVFLRSSRSSFWLGI
jgi:hypothetical protein